MLILLFGAGLWLVGVALALIIFGYKDSDITPSIILSLLWPIFLLVYLTEQFILRFLLLFTLPFLFVYNIGRKIKSKKEKTYLDNLIK